jgi:hypothetical protein
VALQDTGLALDHRIEGVDETCLRRTAMLLDAVPQLVSMALQRLAVGFDEGLETGFAPVSASAMHAHRVLSHVKAQEGKAHPPVMKLKTDSMAS